MKTLSPAHMQIELDRLRAENADLRAALRLNSRHAKRIGRAYDSALLLALWKIAHLDIDRESCQGRGLSQRQFANGMALLRLARVVNGRRWTVFDLPTIEARLRAAQDRAAAVPEAFLARLPACLR